MWLPKKRNLYAIFVCDVGIEKMHIFIFKLHTKKGKNCFLKSLFLRWDFYKMNNKVKRQKFWTKVLERRMRKKIITYYFKRRAKAKVIKKIEVNLWKIYFILKLKTHNTERVTKKWKNLRISFLITNLFSTKFGYIMRIALSSIIYRHSYTHSHIFKE